MQRKAPSQTPSLGEKVWSAISAFDNNAPDDLKEKLVRLPANKKLGELARELNQAGENEDTILSSLKQYGIDLGVLQWGAGFLDTFSELRDFEKAFNILRPPTQPFYFFQGAIKIAEDDEKKHIQEMFKHASVQNKEGLIQYCALNRLSIGVNFNGNNNLFKYCFEQLDKKSEGNAYRIKLTKTMHFLLELVPTELPRALYHAAIAGNQGLIDQLLKKFGKTHDRAKLLEQITLGFAVGKHWDKVAEKLHAQPKLFPLVVEAVGFNYGILFAEKLLGVKTSRKQVDDEEAKTERKAEHQKISLLFEQRVSKPIGLPELKSLRQKAYEGAATGGWPIIAIPEDLNADLIMDNMGKGKNPLALFAFESPSQSSKKSQQRLLRGRRMRPNFMKYLFIHPKLEPLFYDVGLSCVGKGHDNTFFNKDFTGDKDVKKISLLRANSRHDDRDSMDPEGHGSYHPRTIEGHKEIALGAAISNYNLLFIQSLFSKEEKDSPEGRLYISQRLFDAFDMQGHYNQDAFFRALSTLEPDVVKQTLVEGFYAFSVKKRAKIENLIESAELVKDYDTCVRIYDIQIKQKEYELARLKEDRESFKYWRNVGLLLFVAFVVLTALTGFGVFLSMTACIIFGSLAGATGLLSLKGTHSLESSKAEHKAKEAAIEKAIKNLESKRAKCAEKLSAEKMPPSTTGALLDPKKEATLDGRRAADPDSKSEEKGSSKDEETNSRDGDGDISSFYVAAESDDDRQEPDSARLLCDSPEPPADSSRRPESPEPGFPAPRIPTTIPTTTTPTTTTKPEPPQDPKPAQLRSFGLLSRQQLRRGTGNGSAAGMGRSLRGGAE